MKTTMWSSKRLFAIRRAGLRSQVWRASSFRQLSSRDGKCNDDVMEGEIQKELRRRRAVRNGNLEAKENTSDGGAGAVHVISEGAAHHRVAPPQSREAKRFPSSGYEEVQAKMLHLYFDRSDSSRVTKKRPEIRRKAEAPLGTRHSASSTNDENDNNDGRYLFPRLGTDGAINSTHHVPLVTKAQNEDGVEEDKEEALVHAHVSNAEQETQNLREQGTQHLKKQHKSHEEQRRQQCHDVERAAGDVVVVSTVAHAEAVVDVLLQHSRQHGTVFGCDTEVMDIDVKKQGPVGNGRVICVTVFSGDGQKGQRHIDFRALDPSYTSPSSSSSSSSSLSLSTASTLLEAPGPQTLFFDCFPYAELGGELACERRGDGIAVLQALKPFLEDENVRKVWHNYSFDYHVLCNHGFHLRGLEGDTLHMARLANSSRIQIGGGYSLSQLSEVYLSESAGAKAVKVPMKELFGRPRMRRDGTPGNVLELPPIEVLHCDPDPVQERLWRAYAALDAVCTARLFTKLRDELSETQITPAGENGCFDSEEKKDDMKAQSTNNPPGLRPGDMGYRAGAGETFQREQMDEEEKDRGATIPFDACHSLLDVYRAFLRPFAEVLVGMEREGVQVDVNERLPKAEKEAERLRDVCIAAFRQWAARHVGDEVASLMNVASAVQLRQLLYGEYSEKKGSGKNTQYIGEAEKEFYVTLPEGEGWLDPDDMATHATQLSEAREALERFDNEWDRKEADHNEISHTEMPADNVSTTTTKTTTTTTMDGKREGVVEIQTKSKGRGLLPRERERRKLVATIERIESRPPKPKRRRPFVIKGIGMTPPENAWTKKNSGSTSAAIIHKLAGDARPLHEAFESIHERMSNTCHLDDDGGETIPLFDHDTLEDAIPSEEEHFGLMYDFFKDKGDVAEGVRACRALASLSEVSAIDTMLGTFIRPLQALADDKGRIHSSLNIGTESGRLSSRLPNLQNQPALDKDRFGIRRAFEAPPGRALVVADYGQLELRVLAHMANCKSMIRAFELGGDFHSRTAMAMFEHIQKAIEEGKVVLEENAESRSLISTSGDEGDIPLVKDVFAVERKRAKIMNFSIAYGKTEYGLAKDFGMKPTEARSVVDKWYDAHEGVREWQEKTMEWADRDKYCSTILGRRRHFPQLNNKGKKIGKQMKAAIMRAAINTPIQGSAADIVMAAMINIDRDQRLSDMGWKQVLQIHDEIILEGPEESREEALSRVVQHMERPFPWELRVGLAVDAKTASNWYDAK